MSSLIDRYVHQVGNFVPVRERNEIQDELHSQIQDEVEDRFGIDATESDIMTILDEMGTPRLMARQYTDDQYLVGPDLYPIMVLILRWGWLILPTVSVIIQLFVFFNQTSDAQVPILSIFVDLLFGIVSTIALFTGVVVLIFAMIERAGIEMDKELAEFKASELPEVNDPREVQRFESSFGFAFGIIFMLAFIYFTYIGGLTLTIGNPSEIEGIIPIPRLWSGLLVVTGFLLLIVNGYTLRRNRWTARTYLLDTVLETFGVFCMYFALYIPLFDAFMASNEWFASIPLSEFSPEIVAIFMGIMTVIGRANNQVRLWEIERQSA